MIFIENKKAWKSFVKNDPYCDFVSQPKSYPLILELTCVSSGGCKVYDCVYQEDLQSMIDKIDSGREF